MCSSTTGAVSRQYADGSLPAPSVYGLPEQWAHVRAVYEKGGFVHDGQTGIVFIADVTGFPRAEGPSDGVALRRSVGINGIRLSAVLVDALAGHVEVETP